MPILVGSYFKLIQDSDYLIREIEKKTSFSLPKKQYVTTAETPNGNQEDNFYFPTVFTYQKLLTKEFPNRYDFFENSINSWSKRDPQPIGTKPSSMTTTSNFTSNCRNNRFINKNMSINLSSPKLNSNSFEKCKLIWEKNEINAETMENDRQCRKQDSDYFNLKNSKTLFMIY